MGCNPTILALDITTLTCRVGVCSVANDAKNVIIFIHIRIYGVQTLLMSSLVVLCVVSVVISTSVGEITSIVAGSLPTAVTSTTPKALHISAPTVIGCVLRV